MSDESPKDWLLKTADTFKTQLKVFHGFLAMLVQMLARNNSGNNPIGVPSLKCTLVNPIPPDTTECRVEFAGKSYHLSFQFNFKESKIRFAYGSEAIEEPIDSSGKIGEMEEPIKTPDDAVTLFSLMLRRLEKIV